jgi:hypothetical protein
MRDSEQNVVKMREAVYSDLKFAEIRENLCIRVTKSDLIKRSSL